MDPRLDPHHIADHERDSARIEEAWRSTRSRLVDIGYRMLGSVSDAEEIADEAYARLVAADLGRIENPTAWLVSVTGRLCIDRLRSSERSRRAYVGPWLPEPVLTAADPTATDPADRITLDDSVRMALMVVLQQLSPAERTALVLHDFFAMPFDEIARIVGRTPAACRQLASRARRAVRADRRVPRIDVDRVTLEQVARRFADACAAGALEPLIEVLDPDAVGDFDSGGLVPGAPLRELTGATRIARVLVMAFSGGDHRFDVDEVNGQPGVVVRAGDRVVAVASLEVRHGRVVVLHAVGNPEKLRHLRRPTTDH